MERKYSEYISLLKNGKFIRENYFSKTYRVTAQKTDGEKEELDLYHIQIPFTERKERELQARFGITDDELKAYYENFYKNIKKSIAISLYLHKLSTQDNSNKRIANRTAFIREYQCFDKKREGFIDIFILFDKHESFVGTVLQKKNRKADLLEIADRLLQMCNAFAHSVNLGYVDIDSLLVRYDEKGNTYIENPFFLGALCNEVGNYNTPTKDIAFYEHPSVVDGSRLPDTASDYAAVAYLIWMMLEGRHYNNKLDLESYHIYGENLRTQLGFAMNLSTDYSALKAAINEEKNNNPDKIITFDKPFYADDFAEIRRKYAKKEKRESIENRRKPPKKLAALIIAAVCAITVAAAVIAGINLFKSSETENAADLRVHQLYSYNGDVVDYYGSPVDRYSLLDGNIISDTKNIPASLDDAEFTENVVTDGPEDLIYDSKLTIPTTREVIEEYGLTLDKIVWANDEEGYGKYLKIIRITDNKLYCCECRTGEIYKGLDDEIYNILSILARKNEVLELTPKSIGENNDEYVYYDKNGMVYSAYVNEINDALKTEIEGAENALAEIYETDGEIIVPAESVEEYNDFPVFITEKEKYTVTLEKDEYNKDISEFVIKITFPEEVTCRDFRITINKSKGLVIPWDYNAKNIVDSSSRGELKTAVFRPNYGENTIVVIIRGTITDAYRLLITPEAANGVRTVTSVIITDREGYTEDIPDVIELPEEALVSPSPSSSVSPSPTRIPRVVETARATSTKKTSDSGSSTAAKATSSTTPKTTTSTAPQATSAPVTTTAAAETEAPATTPRRTAKPQSDPTPTEYIYNDEPFTVTPSSITLHVGESVSLRPSQSCTFYPSDPVVINMSGRTVIGMEPGSCHITIISMESDQQVTVNVTVVE